MSKIHKYKTKIVGKLTINFCKKYNLPNNYINIKIVQSLGLMVHIQKHLSDFISVDSFNMTMSSIADILSKPYFVYYDTKKNSLRFYKKIKEYVCIVVNLTDNEAYVATMYPINKKNIEKLKQKNS